MSAKHDTQMAGPGWAGCLADPVPSAPCLVGHIGRAGKVGPHCGDCEATIERSAIYRAEPLWLVYITT